MVKQIIEGNQALAIGAKLCRPKVIASYPITPSTHIPETISEFVANGELEADFINVESEHTAMSACIGAQATGVRTFTATASQGLALMHEMLYVASGMRLPIVIGAANRALSAPINIWCFTRDAKVLMGDFVYKPISQVKKGEVVVGKNKQGCLRFARVKRVFRRKTDNLVKLRTDKFELTCTPNHKFYYHPVHTHWAQAKSLKGKSLHWFGFGFNESDEFKRGWISGVVEGDGGFWKNNGSEQFRINVKDREIVDTLIRYGFYFGFNVRETDYRIKEGLVTGTITRSKETTRFREFLKYSNNPDFCRGYLAGMFDAEGSGPSKVKQSVIYNSDPEVIEKVSKSLDLLGIKFKKYVDKRSQNFHIKIDQVPEFFVRCRPTLERKRKNLVNMTLKSVKSRLEIQDVVRMKETHEVYNLETETNNYIVNGFLVHNCDNNDTMAERDSGWLQFYAENNQEALDLVIQAYRIAEQERVLLPAMVAIDAYTLTHTYEIVEVPSQQEVDDFLPPYKPLHAFLDPEHPITQGSFGTPEHYMEFKYSQQKAMERAKEIIDEVFQEFGRRFGRKYQKIEPYRTKDADILLLTLGSMSGTGKEAVDKLRDEGIKVGLAKFIVFRPFPAKELRKISRNSKVLAIVDRNISLGNKGALAIDVGSALVNLEKRPLVANYIVGLGGRDISLENFYEIAEKAEQILETGKVKKPVEWINVRKEEIP